MSGSSVDAFFNKGQALKTDAAWAPNGQDLRRLAKPCALGGLGASLPSTGNY